jgi:DNA-binding GntR family transcriptional regulator
MTKVAKLAAVHPGADDLVSEPGGLVTRLHGQLHEMLLTHEIPLGLPISERQLSLRLGVSRTPLREALRRMEGEGFVQRRGGILEVRRIMLEVEAAGAAAGAIESGRLSGLRTRLVALLETGNPDNRRRIALDLELHRAICEACGNRSMAQLVEQLRRKSMLFATPPVPQNFRQTVLEHMELLDALERGDAERARQVMAEHLDNVQKNVLSRLLKR